MSIWPETKKAAWSKAELFAVAAIYLPPMGAPKVEKYEEGRAQLIGILAAMPGAKDSTDYLELERQFFAHPLCVPALGYKKTVVRQGEDGHSRAETIVALLSGRAYYEAIAATENSVAVYALSEGAIIDLAAAGALDVVQGAIIDKIEAVKILLQRNETLAAELLANPLDPIDYEAPSVPNEAATVPVAPPATPAQ